MNSVLLDTSVIIDFLRQTHKNDALLVNLSKKPYSFSSSILTHTELYSGQRIWKHPTEKKALELILSGITILPLSPHISEKAGSFRAHYKTNIIDAIIAATAFVHNLELVTLNKKHFESIKGLQLHESL